MTRQDAIQAQQQREIREMIALQGFAIRQVFDQTGARPPWAYTVGLYSPGTEHPELLISGLTPELMAAWLLDLGFRMKGPPSLEMQQQAKDLSGGEIEFPPGGMVFHAGRLYRPAEGDLPACFGLVERRYYEDYFGQAITYHGHTDFPVLQFVWSDTRGVFPFEDGYEPRLRDRQDLLFDPQQYLPLKEWEER